VREPKLFLFDEPLSNLDAELRAQMRVELARLHAGLDATMIYVTHDQVEAMTMADRIVVMRDGRIEQVGAPIDLYHAPANQFVAGFIGSPKMNFVRCRVERIEGGRAAVAVAGAQAPLVVPAEAQNLAGGQELVLGLRPEHARFAPEPGAEGASMPFIVDFVEHLGAQALLHGRTATGEGFVVQRAGEEVAHGGLAGAVRQEVWIDPRRCHLFRPDGTAVARRPRVEAPIAA